ncbi:MAG: HD domain-containing protein [Planctomycetota bacterium]
MPSKASGTPAKTGEAELVARLRGELAEGRREIRVLHEKGGEAERVCARLAALFDTLLLSLFEAACDNSPDSAGLRPHVAVVCLGSYARRQCAPYSDVDLMVLHDTRSGDDLRPLVSSLARGVFDTGLQLGHSVRTPAEAVQLAKQDAVVCTSLMDARFLAGNQELFDAFRQGFLDAVKRRGKSLCRAILEARQEERDQYGESVYLLQPHVKRSRGGLRDLNLLRWLGVIQHGEGDPDRLHALSALTNLEHRRIVAARGFLLRLRNEMHFHAGSAADLLDRVEQIRVAEKYGHTHREGLRAVEHLMRDYFRHTNNVWQTVRRREAALTPRSPVQRALDPVFGRRVDGEFRIGVRYISATRADVGRIPKNLGLVLRAVMLSVREGLPLEGELWLALVRGAPDAPERPNDEEITAFLEAVGDQALAGGVLRGLHELRYLKRFVPAMQHARCLLQFNQYHKYTVDEHCLRTVEECTRFQEHPGVLGESYRAVQDRRVLHLALLLHDLGKGFDEDHSEVGRRLAGETAEHLRLGKKETEDLVFLVHQHLAMSHLAFRRDTSDARLIEAFAKKVVTADRLRMLFVLTCADLAAVGPGVLNQWKVDVLLHLFRQVLEVLEGPRGDESGVRQAAWSLAVAQLKTSERSDPWYMTHAEQLPMSIASGRPPRDVAELLRRVHRLAPRSADAWGGYREDTGTLEFIAAVESGAGRGVFSSMAGALTAAGAQILAAETVEMPEGALLLRYEAADPEQPAEPRTERIATIARAMAESVDSPEPPRFAQKWGEEKAQQLVRLTDLPNEVRMHTDVSDQSTVVEVFTFDRVGLLYSLARRLHDLRLVIRHAKIGTYLDQVVDVFYVTERSGKKAVDPARLEEIRQALLEEIESATKPEHGG